MEILKGALATISGFSLYMLFTHPKYLKKRLPKVSSGKIQISPNLKIKLESRIIHFHHWIWLSGILSYLNHIAQGIDHLFFVKFFALGGIIQGLSFKDRFQVLVKKPVKLTSFPKISVVIPAYNEEVNITHVLKSLQKQNYSGNFEVIVADNGSVDNTAKIAKKLGAKVVHVPQKGVAFARDAGFRAASSKIIASTDADSIMPTNWLTKIAEEFQKQPNAVMVSGMYDFYDGSQILRFLTYVFNYRVFCIFGWYSAANMAVRRSAFEKIGGFDTSLPLNEDSDLAIRLRKIGKVARLANFKVKTSARRFNQLGLVVGLWDYTSNYVRSKYFTRYQNKVVFRSGSEVPRLGLAPRLAIHTVIVLAILGVFLGGIYEIKPVKAQVFKREHQLRSEVSRIDIDLPTLPHVHHHR